MRLNITLEQGAFEVISAFAKRKRMSKGRFLQEAAILYMLKDYAPETMKEEKKWRSGLILKGRSA